MASRRGRQCEFVELRPRDGSGPGCSGMTVDRTLLAELVDADQCLPAAVAGLSGRSEPVLPATSGIMVVLAITNNDTWFF
jgi:hypothetical protein